MDRFWIVLADRKKLSARVRHNTRELAQTQALSLAVANPGTRFFVAAVTGAAKAPSPAIPIAGWTELKHPK